MQDGPESSGGDAAEAFEALRAEVTVLRRAVEALPKTWAANRLPDTTPTLIEIAQALKDMGEHLEAVEHHPALRLTPAEHQQAIAQAGRGLMIEAVGRLDETTRATAQHARELAGLIGSARNQDQQLKWLLIAGVAALVFGLVSSPIFARLLPFGLDGRVAAFIMAGDRWEAGGALMQADSPTRWADLVSASELLPANRAVLAMCREAAAKTKKEQRCTLVVPAPRF